MHSGGSIQLLEFCIRVAVKPTRVVVAIVEVVLAVVVVVVEVVLALNLGSSCRS